MSLKALEIIHSISDLETEKKRKVDNIMSYELRPYFAGLIKELMTKLSQCCKKGTVIYLKAPNDYYIEYDNPKLVKYHYSDKRYKRVGDVDIKTFLKKEIKTPIDASLLLNAIQIAERNYKITLFGDSFDEASIE